MVLLFQQVLAKNQTRIAGKTRWRSRKFVGGPTTNLLERHLVQNVQNKYGMPQGIRQCNITNVLYKQANTKLAFHS